MANILELMLLKRSVVAQERLDVDGEKKFAAFACK
jgi:hypothetical protein